jgi:glyoxylase-like metal-dependent hydrolase (beta-lactamase superfamily II)
MTSLPDLPGITVLERGWLSANNILLDDGEAAVLVDSGHCVHAPQTVALLEAALRGRPLRELLNTHLHSDHCGGNATVRRRWGVPVRVPAGPLDAVRAWDEDRLSYRPTGQRCERFDADGALEAGSTLVTGRRHWQVLAAPGHDPDSLMLFDPDDGVLVSADALWENGFGVVFPELDGEQAFEDVARVLDLIAVLPVRVVIPGHGAPFTDVSGALQRARRRLDGFVADPARHARHALKVLVKYHLMEEGSQALADLHAWAAATPLMRRVWGDLAPGRPIAGGLDEVLADLVASGALRQDGEGRVHDA